MSRFFSEKYASLTPYTPGEQPRDMQYIKLNTNESPFPPSPLAIEAAGKAAEKLALYPDPTMKALNGKMATLLGVAPDEILMTNGSDEILNFAFMAFCDEEHPALFPDITYGFYRVFAALNRVPFEEIPLRDDFSICVEDYIGKKGTVFIANPNAPTGLTVSLRDLEKLLAADTDRVVVVDEAYVDFGGESALSLLSRYDNLMVTQTFSKSRSMAGARLGFGVGNKALIADLNTVKYSTNPYNINRMTEAAALGVLSDEAYTKQNCRKIIENRENAAKTLAALGFTMTASKTNFLFVKHDKIEGKALYLALKKRGILVRHFDAPRITAYNRITVGTAEQMNTLIATVKDILLSLERT